MSQLDDAWPGLDQCLDGLVARLRAREAALTEAWEREHGPWPERGAWPPHPAPPCFDCWAESKHGDAEPPPLPAKAVTLIDDYDGRSLVCRAHYEKRRAEWPTEEGEDEG